MHPMGVIVALQATRDHVTSALPGAPIVDDGRGPRTGRTQGAPLRQATARLLRSLAERVEPARPAPANIAGC